MKTALGTDIEDVDMYNTKYRLWVKINLSYPHSLSTDSYIFLRRRGVSCVDLTDILKRFTQPAVHMRYNMPGERLAVREALRRRAVQLDGDSDVEIVAINTS